MAQAGIVKTITGIVSARTSDGQVRQLAVGDVIYEYDIIETAAGSELTIELDDGRILNLAENSQSVIDESVVAVVNPQDAIVAEVQELQAALEEGEDIPDEETTAGEEDPGHAYDLAYDAGDQSGGNVGSYLFGTAYGGEDDDFPDIDGEEEEIPPPPVPPTEPEPVFILGSNPQDYDYDAEREIERPFLDDVEDTSENDYHSVNPAGDFQGAILGQDGADILVGDPGTVTETVDINYILMMDTSNSMSEGDNITGLKAAIKNFIDEVSEKFESNIEGSVKITLLPFASDAGTPAWISFTKTGDDVDIKYNINGIDYSTYNSDEIDNWIDSLSYGGGTDYTDAFTAANGLVDTSYSQNNVIFISDGVPANDSYLQILNSPDFHIDSIQAIGIGPIMQLDFAKKILHEIDSDNDATFITDASSLNDVIPDLVTDINLSPAGSDDLYGNDGDDLIFGDVLNTDGILDDLSDPRNEYYNADYDLSTIEGLDIGSGWEVFANLEEANPDLWTRKDTLQYIQDKHIDLAKETVLGTGTEDGDVRDGGHDYIEGGAGDDIIYGQEGNDEIYGQEGDDVIDAGSGYDVVDGGSGFDTLAVTNETELDFSNVSNIESIDLNEDGVDQTITLSLDQVLSMTDENNILQITGEAGDSVTLTGVGTADGEWTQDAGNPGLFTQNGTANQVTIADFDGDGVDIHVDVDSGTSFDV